MFFAVVIGKDNAAPDVAILAEFRVADVRQMTDFTAVADDAVFKLDEIPYTAPAPDDRVGTDIRNGPTRVSAPIRLSYSLELSILAPLPIMQFSI